MKEVSVIEIIMFQGFYIGEFGQNVPNTLPNRFKKLKFLAYNRCL